MSYDPNDPNGDVQKMIGCGCAAAVAIVILIICAATRLL